MNQVSIFNTYSIDQIVLLSTSKGYPTSYWHRNKSTKKSDLQHLEDYKNKSRENDVIWLLEELQKLTAGIDVKANKRDNMIEAMICFLTMRQGNSESNDDFLRHFNSNLQTLQFTGGSHILCSPDTIDKAGTVATPTEIRKEE